MVTFASSEEDTDEFREQIQSLREDSLESTGLPSDPTVRLGFEINPPGEWWAFAPTYYPDRFVQTKDRKIERNGRQCKGEDVTLKTVKNREFHAKGVVLGSEIPLFQKLLDYGDSVDLISPLTPSGGMECEIKSTELGQKVGFDPVERELMFEFTIDLVSTGKDEYDSGQNSIVTEIISPSSKYEGLAESAPGL